MRGFSLLEMLVVLVLLGMAAALVAPPLARTVDRVRASGERDDLRRLLQSLPVLVRQTGRAAHWPADTPVVLPQRSWPEGWQVIALTPLAVAANGWCSEAQLLARGPDITLRLAVAAPDCRVEELADAP